MVKKLPAVQETWVPSLGWEDPWRREWQITPVFLPRKSHGQRNLARLQPMHYRKTNTLFLQVTVEMCCLEGLGGGVEDNSQVSGWDKCTALH